MTFQLADLLVHPDWHQIAAKGTIGPSGMTMDVPDEHALKFDDLPALTPQKNKSPAALDLEPETFKFEPSIQRLPPAEILKLPDAIREERLAKCRPCEHNIGGRCSKCLHCGGSLIEYKVDALFEFCPLTPPQWGPYIPPSTTINGSFFQP
jgi:hypothetical protein